MYICNECGHVFDEPGTIVERHPYGDTYAEEVFGVCPSCGEGNFDHAVMCNECGEYFSSENMYGDMCSECFAECRKEVATAICSVLTKEQFESVSEYLLDYMDYIFEDVDKMLNSTKK